MDGVDHGVLIQAAFGRIKRFILQLATAPLRDHAGGVPAPPFSQLQLWIDPQPRSGPQNMAVDEWLLATASQPLLRVYGWLGDWVSYGYSLDEAEARRHFPDPGLRYVRRWTGGGVVDHRHDWTYTVVIPSTEPLAARSAPQRYFDIHAAVAATLQAEGIPAALSSGATATGSEACFENPVTSDITAADGAKLGGAGQRRSRDGVLHQGSILTPCDLTAPAKRALALAKHLAADALPVDRDPDPAAIAASIESRYGNPAWVRGRQGPF